MSAPKPLYTIFAFGFGFIIVLMAKIMGPEKFANYATKYILKRVANNKSIPHISLWEEKR